MNLAHIPIWTLVPAIWLIVNLLYGLWIEGRRRRWESGILRDADGVAADAAPFTLGDGTDAVLLIHGFADSPAVFRGMAANLAAHGLTCRVMRLPGAAEPLPIGARQTLATWMGAVLAEATALRATHRNVWLLGHSMGAALALLAQLEEPATANGLILLAPMLAVSSARAPLLSPRLWFRIAQVALPLARILESCFPPNVLTHDAAAIRYTRDRFIPFATYKNLFQLTDRLRGRGPALNVPFFAVLAASDPIVSTPVAQAWLATCQGSRCQIETLKNCGHAIPQETARLPELCERIAAFILMRSKSATLTPQGVSGEA